MLRILKKYCFVNLAIIFVLYYTKLHVASYLTAQDLNHYKIISPRLSTKVVVLLLSCDQLLLIRVFIVNFYKMYRFQTLVETVTARQFVETVTARRFVETN